MITVPRSKTRRFAAVASVLVLSTVSQGSAARQDITAIAVFMNEGRTNIQVDVVSEDKKDKTILPLHPGQMERTSFSRGHVELHTVSTDIVSGRLLSSRSMPTPISAPEFMEPRTRTFYFRVVGAKILLVKLTDLTAEERRRLDERTKEGW
jgi:hypothetical protein